MEDHAIVQLYWERDRSAIPATAEKYGNYCTAIAQNILGDRRDAEECVNDTWFLAWQSIPPHRHKALAAFLGKLTRNLSINRYQRDRAQKRGGGQLPLALEELSAVLSDGDTVEQAVDGALLAQSINGFLAALPPQKRRLFICRYWYFDSVTQIAARFGLSENQVSVTLSRLRHKLRAYLTERGFEL